MRVDILLTHHGTHELDRCIKVGPAYLCARCAGMYPAMAIGLWASLAGAVEMGGPAVTLGMSAAGVSAWGLERIRPLRLRGANVVRAAGGAVLGLALGEMLGRHLVEPFAPRVVGQIVLIAALGAAFLLVDLLAGRAVRKARDRDENRSTGAGAP